MFEDRYRFSCDKCKRVFFAESEGLNISIKYCPTCGYMGVSKCVCICGSCHKPMYEGDDAYRISKIMYCTDCVKRVEM